MGRGLRKDAVMPPSVRRVRTKRFIKDMVNAREIMRFCSWRYAGHIYIGCTHACAYCYARFISPSHYGRFVVIRENLLSVLKREIRIFNEKFSVTGKKPIINLGSITDPYQPVEAKQQITQRVVQLFVREEIPFLLAVSYTHLTLPTTERV